MLTRRDILSHRLREEEGKERMANSDGEIALRESGKVSSPRAADLDEVDIFPNLQLSRDEIGVLRSRIDLLGQKSINSVIDYKLDNHAIEENDIASNGEGDRSVSSTGSWCKEASKSNGRQHLTDLKLAGFLAEFLAGKKVI